MTDESEDLLLRQSKRVDEIREREGDVTPEAIVKDARNPSSPFHGEFDWNVERAAQAHWEEVARSIIRRFRVPVSNPAPEAVGKFSVNVPAFVRDPDAPGNVQSYISIERVRGDADKTHKLLCAEFTRIAGLLTRVYAMAEYLNRTEDVQPLMDRFSATRHLFDQPEATQ